MADARELTGIWALVEFKVTFEDGDMVEPFGPRPVGRLIYDPSGVMSAHLMASDRAPLAEAAMPSAEKALTAMQAHFSYSGRWRVEGDEVLHDVEMSVSPDWTGATKTRLIAFDGDELILTETRQRIGRRVGSGALRWRREG